jgi:hypothetical protein
MKYKRCPENNQKNKRRISKLKEYPKSTLVLTGLYSEREVIVNWNE